MRDRRIDHALDALVVSDVQRQRQRLAAQCFDLRLETAQRCRVAAGDDQVRTGPRKRAAKVLSQAAAGAGDDGDFAGEIKQACRS